MDFKKTVINVNVLIGIIIAIIFLILAIAMVLDYKNNYDYDVSVLQCGQFIDSVNGEGIYFDNLNQPSPAFDKGFKNLCPSKTFKINKKSVKTAVELADDCWSKFGKGREFIGPYMLETKMCFYCGNVIADSEIENLNTAFMKIINEGSYDFDESESAQNLNEVYLNEDFLPSKLNKGDNLSVFYLIYKDPDFSENNNYIINFYNSYKVKVEGAISSEGGWLGLVTDFLADSDNVDVFSGVLITKNLDNLTELGCDTFIPIENYKD